MEKHEASIKNLQYIDPLDEKENKRIFISYANSYHAKEIVKKIYHSNDDENAKIFYEVFGTFKENRPFSTRVQKLFSKNSDFLSQVAKCDIIICDISQDKNQLEEAKMIIKFLEESFENGYEFNLTIVLISSIMTWASTPTCSSEVLSDKNFRKRRPHPCFNQHLMIERKFLNLNKKYGDVVKSFVICPGILYGEEEDIFHYIFKNCYFNYPQVDIFLPGSNKLPLIYIHDFVRIIMKIITKQLDGANYFLSVQPEPLSAVNIVSSLIEAMGVEEMRIRICEKEEIFLMNENDMTQRVFDHLTLDLPVHSELLSDFAFEITGSTFLEKIPKVVSEFFDSKKLRPTKILVNGSSFSYQNEIAKMLADFYHLHHVKDKCFLKNFMIRLKKKIEGAKEYQRKMESIAPKLNENVDFLNMMNNVQNDMNNNNEKISAIEDILRDSDEVKFDAKKLFVKERLSSNACSKNQGYVMSGFGLDREKASFLFLDSPEDDLNFFKPDFVVILNRNMDIEPECLEIEGFDENESDETILKQWELKAYYDTQHDDISLYNFFSDHNIIPIAVNIERDLTQLDLIDIFEKLKRKIGEPSTFELSCAEKLEIEKIKNEIVEKEKLEREAEKRLKSEAEQAKKEAQIEEWAQQIIEQKKKELKQIEEQSLPVRHYLMKHIIPKLSTGIVELAKVRPSNPMQFLAHRLSQHDENEEDKDLDEEVVQEFQRLVNASKFD